MESLKLNTFLGVVKDRLRLLITHVFFLNMWSRRSSSEWPYICCPHSLRNLIEAPVSHDILTATGNLIFLTKNVTTAN